MKRIIDIEKDYYEIIKYDVEHGEQHRLFKTIANSIPYEERPQGEWILVQDKYGESFECPFCSKQVCGTDLNFCVKCGAKMRGKEE